MSPTIQCTHCKYPMAVKDERSSAIFCASCGLFVDPFYTWKKTDIQSLTLPSRTSVWIPLVISASLKDAPVSSWVSIEHQVIDPDHKWGRIIHGYLARHICDVDRGWILHKKIYDAIITNQADDLISMSLEVVLERDLNVIVDIHNTKIGMTSAIEKYDGVITRTNFLGKNAAAIHIFNQSALSAGKHAMNPPVSPKKAVENQEFLNSLKTTWQS